VIILFPFLLVLAGYQLGWYGYATLQQPVPCGSGSKQGGATGPCGSGCTGFVDLILPSHISTVDNCISNNWNKGSSNTINGQPANSNPNQPLFTAPSGQPISGTVTP
jgi:hypothetical protein